MLNTKIHANMNNFMDLVMVEKHQDLACCPIAEGKTASI